ncbi:uncharacterized protein K452DRAFT_247364, partial [Aplosporella prunicola CBS 121167]
MPREPHQPNPILHDEPTILQYARFHGIAKKFTSQYPLDPDLIPTAPIFLSEGLLDPVGAVSLELPRNFRIEERLCVNEATLAFLQSTCSVPKLHAEKDPFMARLNRVRNFKAELPILSSDNEMDMKRFLKQPVVDLGDTEIQPEHVDEEKDEGMAWPTKCETLPADYDKQVASEKLQVSRNILLYLQNTLKCNMTPEEIETTIEAEVAHEKRQDYQPITPPLLPMSPLLNSFADPKSSSPTCHLELLSDLTDSTAIEAAALEAELMKQDSIVACDKPAQHASSDDSITLGEIDTFREYSPLYTISDPPVSSPLKRTAEDLKVEVPLTPPTVLQYPNKKMKIVSFSDDLHEYVPELPSTFENGDDVLDSQNSFDAFFAEEIEPIADDVLRQAEQEQLQEVDTTHRVDVPVMDFSLPPAPWDTYSRKVGYGHGRTETELDVQKQLLSRCAKEELKLAPVWRGVSKLDTELHWSPFPPQLAKVAPNETLQDDDALEKMVSKIILGETVDVDLLVWKPDGLRILDESSDDEEELEPANFTERNDITSLVRKRQLEMLDEEDRSVTRPKMFGDFVSATALMKQRQQVEERARRAQQNNMPKTTDSTPLTSNILDGGLALGGMFSTSSAVSKFMDLQNGIASTVNPLENPGTLDTSEENLRSYGRQDERKAPNEEMLPPPAAADETHTAALPGPPIPSTLPAQTFIISSAIVSSQRNLLRHIEMLYPNIDLIERDSGNANARFPEADIIVSRATGLLITTLQKIKQRPLPGQVQISGIKERVARVSGRYERVVVLVSEGRIETAAGFPAISSSGSSTAYGALDQRDCEAFAAFAAFAASLDADINVWYIAGGDAELARWVVGLMAQYG